jgi:hypothetical protein
VGCQPASSHRGRPYRSSRWALGHFHTMPSGEGFPRKFRNLMMLIRHIHVIIIIVIVIVIIIIINTISTKYIPINPNKIK